MKHGVMWFWVVLSGSMSALEAVAGPVPTRLLDERSYGDEVAAVVAAGERYLRKSHHEDREYFGAIFADVAGRHWLTVGRGAVGQDRFAMAVRAPAGMRLRAFWHTHGRAGSEREHFSGPDAELVRSTGKGLYLITPSAKVRLLRPGSPGLAAHRLRLRSTVGFRVAIAGETIADLARGLRRT